MDAKIKDRELGRLLNGLVVAQRQDIDAYSRGHLNENKLYRAPEMSGHQPWNSSQKKQIRMRQKSQIPPPAAAKGRSPTSRAEGMKHVMTNFSMGTSAHVPPLPPVSKHKTSKDMYNQRSQVWTSVEDERLSTMQSTNSLDRFMRGSRPVDRRDNVLVEELSIPEMMLKTPISPSRVSRSKAWAEEEPNDDDELPEKPVSQGQIKSRNLARFQHKFIPSHLEAVTKKDQFKSFQNFENSVLRKQDAMETNVLAGLKSVEHLERKLQKVCL